MIITGVNATFDDLLKMPINEQSIINDPMLKEMKEYGVPSLPLEDLNDIPLTFDIMNCNNWNLNNMKTSVNCVWSEAKKKVLDVIQLTKIEFEKLIHLPIKKMFTELWNQVKQIFIDLWQNIKTQFNNVIKFFTANYKKIINWFKSLKGNKLTKEQKKKRRKQLINELKRLGNDVCEMFGIYIIIDFIKCSWTIMKNLFGCNKNAIDNAIDIANETDQCINSLKLNEAKRIGKLIGTLQGVIQIFGVLLVTTLGIIDTINAQKEINEEQLNDSVDIIKAENDKMQNDLTNLQNLSDLSPLEKSLNDENKDTSNKVIISICPVYEDNNATTILSNNGYIIEFGKDLTNFKISVNINQNIELNSIIGYINNVPIKSKICGIVKHITDRHIVIDKIEINTENAIDKVNASLSKISLDSKSEMEVTINDISNKLINMNNIELLIKDYLDMIYKPIIYSKDNHSQTAKNNVKDIYSELKNEHKTLKEEFENDIRTICSADNVSTYANSNNLNELKDLLLNKKYTFINNIFNNIETYTNTPHYSTLNEEDYTLCDYYLQFITSDNFNNSYYDKLFNIIKGFYLTRYNIESHNKSDLIKKFNNYLKDDKIKNKSFISIKNDLENKTYKSIKEYLNEIYPDSFEIKSSRVNMLSNLYIIINELPNNRDVTINKSLKELTYNESIILLDFINDLKKEYESYKNVINDLYNIYNIINWPVATETFINNEKYTHYLFTLKSTNTNELNNFKNATQDDYDNPMSSITAAEPNTLLYWLKYCAMATAINCTLPMYWATGLVIMGAPIPLPIILIPFVYIDGPIPTVIGLSICGIAISPMLLVINMTDEIGAALFAINMAIDATKQMVVDLRDVQYKAIGAICKGMLRPLDDKIKSTQDQIKEINNQIALLKNL